MKETKLAKVYIDALGLGRNSAAAYDLTKFKQPSAVFRSKYAVRSYGQHKNSISLYLLTKSLGPFPEINRRFCGRCLQHNRNSFHCAATNADSA